MKLAIALTIASAHPQPQQFDLICSGFVHSISVTQQPDTAYLYRYRIDLRSARWCDGSCEATRPIAEVQPNLLRLEQQTNIDGRDHLEKLTSSIDRTTGAHHITSESRDNFSGRLLIMWNGNCTPAPFSGFPSAEIKF